MQIVYWPTVNSTGIFLEQFQCLKSFEIQNLNKNLEAFSYCKGFLVCQNEITKNVWKLVNSFVKSVLLYWFNYTQKQQINI